MDYKSRHRQLQTAMARQGLDAVVYGIGANMQYFSGALIHWTRENEPPQPDSMLVASRDAEPVVILSAKRAAHAAETPWMCQTVADADELEATLGRMLSSAGRVGTSRSAAAYLGELLGKAVPDATVSDAEGLGEEMRVIKDADEIALLRRVVALTDRVLEMIVPHIRPGITQPELQAMIAEAGMGLGARDVSFPPASPYVKSGTEPSADPFVYPKDKGLVPGTSVAFDFGFVLDGYCSDFGRSFYCGPAPMHIAGAYEALQAAQCEVISRMRPGALKLNELFGVIEAALDERGYGDRLRARLPDGGVGHQIGIELHETPKLRRENDVPLKAGMVMAIEPKVWLPGEYYLRVEDIVLVTEDGAESLTKADRKSFEVPAV